MSSLIANDPIVFRRKNRVQNVLMTLLCLIGLVFSVRELFMVTISLNWLGSLAVTVLWLMFTIDFFQLAFWTRLLIVPEGIQYRHLFFTALIEWSNIKLEPTYMRADGSCEYKLLLKTPILNPDSLLSGLLGKNGQKKLLRLDEFVSNWRESPLIDIIKQHTDTENERALKGSED